MIGPAGFMAGPRPSREGQAKEGQAPAAAMQKNCGGCGQRVHKSRQTPAASKRKPLCRRCAWELAD